MSRRIERDEAAEDGRPQPASYDDEYSETQQKLLTSRSLARKTLDALRLWRHPYFGGPTSNATDGSSTRGATGWKTSSIVPLVRSVFRSKAETTALKEPAAN